MIICAICTHICAAVKVNAWADGSPWKRNFQAKNPSSVYVEVQNYFVKSLTGWTLSDGPVTAQTLEMAKHVLNQIDIVLLTEEMRLPNTTNWLEYTLKLEGKRVNKGKRVGTGYQSLFQDKANRVDRKEVQRLESLLAPDKVYMIVMACRLSCLRSLSFRTKFMRH